MTTHSSKQQDPKSKRAVIQWLLESDPSIRWQVMRGLTDATDDEIAPERAKVATEGWGARLLARQEEDGHWGGDPSNPEWTCLLHLLWLQEMGLDPQSEEARRAVTFVRDNVTWHWWDNHPFFVSEVEPCINGRIVQIGAYFGQDVQGLVDRLLGEQMDDGGWNCKQENGSTRGSVHTTINVLDGLLAYERGVEGSAEVREARLRGEAYLLERRMLRRQSTGYHYDVLRGLDYMRSARIVPDDRVAEAVELIGSKRNADGQWPLENPHPDQLDVAMDPGGGQPVFEDARPLRVEAPARPARLRDDDDIHGSVPFVVELDTQIVWLTDTVFWFHSQLIVHEPMGQYRKQAIQAMMSRHFRNRFTRTSCMAGILILLLSACLGQAPTDEPVTIDRTATPARGELPAFTPSPSAPELQVVDWQISSLTCDDNGRITIVTVEMTVEGGTVPYAYTIQGFAESDPPATQSVPPTDTQTPATPGRKPTNAAATPVPPTDTQLPPPATLRPLLPGQFRVNVQPGVEKITIRSADGQSVTTDISIPSLCTDLNFTQIAPTRGPQPSPTATPQSSSNDLPSRPVCSDGLDNDGDGYVDLFDPNCKNKGDQSESR